METSRKPPSTAETTENKPRRLRLLSTKPASEIQDDVREDMLSALMEKPEAESLTRKFGSTLSEVVFSILWVMAWKVERLERLKAQQSGIRDGFGSPKLAEIPRKGVTSETSVREFRSVGAA